MGRGTPLQIYVLLGKRREVLVAAASHLPSAQSNPCANVASFQVAQPAPCPSLPPTPACWWVMATEWSLNRKKRNGSCLTSGEARPWPSRHTSREKLSQLLLSNLPSGLFFKDRKGVGRDEVTPKPLASTLGTEPPGEKQDPGLFGTEDTFHGLPAASGLWGARCVSAWVSKTNLETCMRFLSRKTFSQTSELTGK